MSAIAWTCPPDVAAQFGRAVVKFEVDHPQSGVTQTVVVDERAGWQQVAEMHYCDRWDLQGETSGGGYRCGLSFGDGRRCHVTRSELGRSWSTWVYLRPVPDHPG